MHHDPVDSYSRQLIIRAISTIVLTKSNLASIMDVANFVANATDRDSRSYYVIEHVRTSRAKRGCF